MRFAMVTILFFVVQSALVESRGNLRSRARDYNKKVNKEGSCSKPSRTLIPVNNAPDKIFLPHCAILHRCSQDSGCCQSATKVCDAKKTELVKLPFLVSELMSDGSHGPLKPIALTFVNHTECACKSQLA
ncbi:vascular endothelial growth factor C-like [Centruroides sculpturatus]|uniref:vascular endothelial growth factor C-like n=1 Tax=Centruroides sculpturatus TaxID=218467 RepID=UPI000C6D34F0|nr:vascular endothelial growth factor C-like [Centruroides sculpturatus]